MKKILPHISPFLFLFPFLFFLTSPAFSQSNSDSGAQKKSKLFLRLDGGVDVIYYTHNNQFFPFASEYNLKPGLNFSLAVGYTIAPKIRLGLGGDLLMDIYYNFMPVYATFEYGGHTKPVSWYYDINCGYTLHTGFDFDGPTSDGGSAVSKGAFVELLPGISYHSKKTSCRTRIAFGAQLETTHITNSEIDESENLNPPGIILINEHQYFNSLIIRFVFKMGLEF